MSNFTSFPHYFIYIFLTSRVKLHIHLLNAVVQFIVFLTLSSQLCRSTDISKCFSKSLEIRDNGSRLYMKQALARRYKSTGDHCSLLYSYCFRHLELTIRTFNECEGKTEKVLLFYPYHGYM